MDVYFSVLFVIILVCLLSNGKGDGRVPLGISILAIYLMITFQKGWGGDGQYYIAAVDYFHGMSFKELLEDETHGEIGYKVVFAFFPSYESINFVFSAFYCFALYVLLYQFVPRKWWALFFFFLFINRPLLMGGLCAIARTGFAVASFIIGMYFLAKGQRWKCVVIILISSLFHTSILFLLPLVFLSAKPNKMTALIGVVVFAAILLFFLLIPSAWTNLVETFIAGVDFFEGYETYFESEEKERQISVLVVFSFFWVYELFVHGRKLEYSRNDYLVMKMALVQIVFSFLPSVGLSGRFYYYLNYGFFAGMMVMLEKEKNEVFRWIMVISLIFVFGKKFLDFYNTPYFAEYWMHYHAFWN